MKGSEKMKIKDFNKSRDGAIAYAKLRDYYDQDGNRIIYGWGVLLDILTHELNHDTTINLAMLWSNWDSSSSRLINYHYTK